MLLKTGLKRSTISSETFTRPQPFGREVLGYRDFGSQSILKREGNFQMTTSRSASLFDDV
jgi:hypothetical protein